VGLENHIFPIFQAIVDHDPEDIFWRKVQLAAGEFMRPFPKKRIVICCDGTWQSSSHGNRETPSNPAKLSHSLSQLFVNEDGIKVPQVIYYDAGVGTEATAIGKRLSGKLFKRCVDPG
jgi:hypothetical protein